MTNLHSKFQVSVLVIKIGPLNDPFDLILCFSLVPLVVYMCAKFEVSSFTPFLVMEGPKISKVGHVTLS